MRATRKKSMSIIYNGAEAWTEIFPYMEKFTYTDSVDASDKISISIADRDLKWIKSWIPETGDIILPTITLENWNYEGERCALVCGTFIVDDFSFSMPPVMGSINGVSAPVNTSFKETQITKTWEAATVQLIAIEIATKYNLELIYDAQDVQVTKMEQSNQTDSAFIRSLCEKYGLGIKVYFNRLIIWNYKKYFAKPPILTLTPWMVTKMTYKSTLQGTYTGARVSYTNLDTKETVDIVVGTEERMYKTIQKADNEADARMIGEAAILNANRKETTVQITLPPNLSLVATNTVQLSGFGKVDGKYFIETVSHTISNAAYNMQINLSRINHTENEWASGKVTAFKKTQSAVESGDSEDNDDSETLW